jgi:hypothetical protein
MTKKEAIELVEQNGLALEYVPDELRTPEVCDKAVGQDGLALKYVPDELMTREVCEKAVGQDGRAIIYVPFELWDEVKAAVETRRGERGMV